MMNKLSEENPSCEEELNPETMSIRELLVETYRFVREIKEEYDQRTETMEITSKELEDLFAMGDRTLTRWRTSGMLRFHVDEKGHVYHLFTEVFHDVKSGRIKAKGFNRQASLNRLRAFRLGVLKGKLENEDYFGYGNGAYN